MQTETFGLELQRNLDAASRMVRDVVTRLTPEQWTSAQGGLRSPARITWHLVEALDFYFRENEADYVWGSRFGAPQWKTADADLPSQDTILSWLDEIVLRAGNMLRQLTNDDLREQNQKKYRHGENRLGHYVYALRHTMHHMGQLSAIAVAHGHRNLLWA